VASFLLDVAWDVEIDILALFSSLSESGFIPTNDRRRSKRLLVCESSHLFQRVASFLRAIEDFAVKLANEEFSSLSESGFIPTREMFTNNTAVWLMFSSLSESGFIPTFVNKCKRENLECTVLISFREWLHSYLTIRTEYAAALCVCSHLFQRVASFLPTYLNV